MPVLFSGLEADSFGYVLGLLVQAMPQSIDHPQYLDLASCQETHLQGYLALDAQLRRLGSVLRMRFREHHGGTKAGSFGLTATSVGALPMLLANRLLHLPVPPGLPVPPTTPLANPAEATFPGHVRRVRHWRRLLRSYVPETAPLRAAPAPVASPGAWLKDPWRPAATWSNSDSVSLLADRRNPRPSGCGATRCSRLQSAWAGKGQLWAGAEALRPWVEPAAAWAAACRA